MKKKEEQSGIDRMRRAVSILNACNETFNQRWTSEELLKIIDVHILGEWDVYPDTWTTEQCTAAIEHGTTAKFEETRAGLHALDVTDCGCRNCRVKRSAEEIESADTDPPPAVV